MKNQGDRIYRVNEENWYDWVSEMSSKIQNNFSSAILESALFFYVKESGKFAIPSYINRYYQVLPITISKSNKGKIKDIRFAVLEEYLSCPGISSKNQYLPQYIFVFDDIYDSGETAAAVRDALVNAYGKKNIVKVIWCTPIKRRVYVGSKFKQIPFNFQKGTHQIIWGKRIASPHYIETPWEVSGKFENKILKTLNYGYSKKVKR